MCRNPPDNGLRRGPTRCLAPPLLAVLCLLAACAPSAKWEDLMVEAEMALQEDDLHLADERYRAALRTAEGFESDDARLDLTLDRLENLAIAAMQRLGPSPKPLDVGTPPSHHQVPYKPVPVPAPVAAQDGAYAVHLASYRSAAKARRGWHLLKEIFPRLLGNLEMTTEAADLGEHGTFRRVMTGPFGERTAAEALCDRLKARAQYCRVVGRQEQG